MQQLIGSALGVTQLRKLEANLARRRQIAKLYGAAFSATPGVNPPLEQPNFSSAWHLYPIRLDLPALRFSRAEVFAALRAENIGVNVHYIPVHYHPYYRERFGHKRGEYPRAEAAYESLISLPMFHGMTAQDAEDVVTAVQKVVQYSHR